MSSSGCRARNSGKRRTSQNVATAKVTPLLLADVLRRLRDVLQPHDNRPVQPVAGAGDLDSPMQPHKQTDTEFALQQLDLLTDRGLRHAQFLGSTGEALVACSGFEHQQAGHTRQPSR